MASYPDSDEEKPHVQVVASCDNEGVTVINEDASTSMALEEGLVEVAYINISEAMMLDEIEGIDSSMMDDDATRQSWEFGALEIEEDAALSEEEAATVNERDSEEQIAVTNAYLAGQISFQDFITRVEGPKNPEETSDIEENDDNVMSTEEDPEYVPPPPEPKKSKGKGLKGKPVIVESAIIPSSGEIPKASKPSQKKVKKVRKLGPKIIKKLPANLLALMGEANLRWARNEKEDAINLCMEVIRQAPSYAEPFQTLSMFYEELEEYEKAYQLSLIAAYLSPQDADEWLRLYELCHSRNDLEQASKCLAKAVQADPSNLEIHKRRCELLESMGAQQELVEAYLNMLRGVHPDDDKKAEWVELAVRIARMRHASGHFHSARRALSNALIHCADNFSMENYNLLLDLLILTKRYIEVVKVLHKHCGLVLDKPKIVDELDLQEATTMSFSQDLPIDIQSKLCIALIHCKKTDFASPLVDSILDLNVDDYGDIYLDVAEALMEKKLFEEAVVLFESLVSSQTYSLPAVWLKLAHCFGAIPERTEEAIDAYKQVIELAPSNPDARLALAALLTSLGRYEEALEAVTQDSEAATIEASVLHHRCLLLLQEDRMDQFVQTYKLLMMRHSKSIRSKDDIHIACGAKRTGWESEEEAEEDEQQYGSTSIPLEEEFRLLRLAIEYLYNQKRLVEVARMCFTALTSSLFRRRREVHREIHFLTLQVCITKGDSYYAYNLVRGLLTRSTSNLYNNRVWNLFIQVIMKGDDIRYNRFLMRLLVKHPDNLALSVLNGHACVACGTYKYALDEYLSACKMDPENPFFLLLSAVVLIQLTCQKFSSSKHSLVTQATAFFDSYMRTRGDCQEVYYNIGRGMHQLGLLPQALEFYKKALKCPPSVTKGKHASSFDLTREIAFNLSLIYRAADPAGLDIDIARMYINKYIVI